MRQIILPPNWRINPVGGREDIDMAIFKCKMCGGNLDVAEETTVCECEYCGTKQTVPKTRDDVMSNLFNRANNLRIKCEFDKAQEIYEKIVASDPTEAEAYWGLVLCKYGIEYVEDPATFRKIPTCHRTQLESVMTDVDYLAAIEHADVVQRSVYEEEARAIDKLQKDILEIVHKEQPFDVFICYKETDESGKRTGDSVIANDIYYQLTNEGFKVFYAAITLEDKLGQEYEPYIFAALNSARVMLVIGSKAEYFNAVWVKNEWSRYMKLMKSDRKKLLIPCYKDMDAYDLPEEFSHLQAQDMSKIGFINDVIRGIKKVIVKEEAPKSPAPVQTVVSAPASANVENLLKRGMLSLEDGKWEEADRFFEQVLNENVEEPRAYLGKLLCKQKAASEDNLVNSAPSAAKSLEQNEDYKKAYRFAGAEFKAHLADLNNRYIFSSGMKRFNSAKTENDFIDAKAVFLGIADYQPAKEKSAECMERAAECVYTEADKILSESRDKSNLAFAREEFGRISGHRDAAEKAALCEQKIKQIEDDEKEAVYQKALGDMREDTLDTLRTALSYFGTISGWKDSHALAAECRQRIAVLQGEREREHERRKQEMVQKRILNEQKAKKRKTIAAIIGAAVVVIAAALVVVFVVVPMNKYKAAVELVKQGEYEEALVRLEKMRDHEGSEKQIEICEKNLEYQYGVSLLEQEQYEEALAVFEKLDGLNNSRGLIVDCQRGMDYNLGVSLMEKGEYVEAFIIFQQMDGFKDANELLDKIIREYAGQQTKCTLYAGDNFTLGVKEDGTVIATGSNIQGMLDVSEWTDIIEISAGYSHTVGLKSDGTVVAQGGNENGETDVSEWTGIVDISAGTHHTVGLKEDGTVVATGKEKENQCNVSGWNNIIAVSAGSHHTVGLKADGTVVACGDNSYGECNVSEWTGIIAIAAGGYYTVGLKTDGTTVVAGYGVEDMNLSDWTDIVAVSVSLYHLLGLKSDGTVVAAGGLADGRGDVAEWKDIVAVSAGTYHSLGLKSDGTVVAAGKNKYHQCDVSDWTNIKTTND